MECQLSISSTVTRFGYQFDPAWIANGTELTSINYMTAALGNPGMFGGMPDDTVVTVGGQQWYINYNDVPTSGPYLGSVTLTAVPEASAFLTVGLIGLCAIAAFRIGKRCGIRLQL